MGPSVSSHDPTVYCLPLHCESPLYRNDVCSQRKPSKHRKKTCPSLYYRRPRIQSILRERLSKLAPKYALALERNCSERPIDFSGSCANLQSIQRFLEIDFSMYNSQYSRILQCSSSPGLRQELTPTTNISHIDMWGELPPNMFPKATPTN